MTIAKNKCRFFRWFYYLSLISLQHNPQALSALEESKLKNQRMIFKSVHSCSKNRIPTWASLYFFSLSWGLAIKACLWGTKGLSSQWVELSIQIKHRPLGDWQGFPPPLCSPAPSAPRCSPSVPCRFSGQHFLNKDFKDSVSPQFGM